MIRKLQLCVSDPSRRSYKKVGCFCLALADIHSKITSQSRPTFIPALFRSSKEYFILKLAMFYLHLLTYTPKSRTLECACNATYC